MTFKEFSKAIKKDPRLIDLLDRCDPTCEPLTDTETQELVNRTKQICSDKESTDS